MLPLLPFRNKFHIIQHISSRGILPWLSSRGCSQKLRGISSKKCRVSSDIESLQMYGHIWHFNFMIFMNIYKFIYSHVKFIYIQTYWRCYSKMSCKDKYIFCLATSGLESFLWIYVIFHSYEYLQKPQTPMLQRGLLPCGRGYIMCFLLCSSYSPLSAVSLFTVSVTQVNSGPKIPGVPEKCIHN